MNTLRDHLRALCLAVLVFCAPLALGEEQELADLDGPGRINEYFVDGSFMINPKTKLSYELHYWETNITGSSESDYLLYKPQDRLESNYTHQAADESELLNRDLFMMDESSIEEYEKNLLKRSDLDPCCCS